MKKISLILFFILLIPSVSFSRDFIVEFMIEHYKQADEQFSRSLDLYHSIQVNSIAGPKILVLKGVNNNYRTWLREYIAENKKLIVKVPDSENDLFISSKAYEIDISLIHPFDSYLWEKSSAIENTASFVKGTDYILIVDKNPKRSSLIKSVLSNMGYSALIAKDAKHALESFKLQPEKFKMIITDHDLEGMKADKFVNTIVSIDSKIPVLIGSGYRNKSNKEKLSNSFSNTGSVHVIPVVLKDLKNRIQTILESKA